MPHAACGRVEFFYFLEIYLYCTCRGIVASGHHPGLNEKISAICEVKMGDGCWLQFPQRLREPGPGSLRFPPPPTEYCII
jgi:hypothetical protein